jgi:hypothetical protein
MRTEPDDGEGWLEAMFRSIARDIGVTFNNQDFRGPLGVAAAEDATYLTWPDSRAGGEESDVEDAYMTRIRHGPTTEFTGAAPVSGSAAVLWAVIGGGIAFLLAGVILVVAMQGARPRAAARAQPTPAGGGSD